VEALLSLARAGETEKARERLQAIVDNLYGQMSDIGVIKTIADRFGLVIIEDARQAIGAECDGKKAGSIGTGAFSLSPESILNSIGVA